MKCHYYTLFLLFIFSSSLTIGQDDARSIAGIRNLNRITIYNIDGERIKDGILEQVSDEEISVMTLKNTQLSDKITFNLDNISTIKIKKRKNKNVYMLKMGITGFTLGFITGVGLSYFITRGLDEGEVLWDVGLGLGAVGAAEALIFGVIHEPHLKIQFNNKTENQKQIEKLKKYQLQY